MDYIQKTSFASKHGLMEGEYFGTLTSQDLQGIFEVLKTTETLTNKEKKRFGII